MSGRRRAFVTVVLGAAYQAFYRREIFPSHQRLAKRLGVDLVVIDRSIATASNVTHPHASWEKTRIFMAPQTSGYDQLCWLDADLYAMREAPDPFELAEDGWLAVDNNTCASAEQARLDAQWYWFLAPEVQPSALINTGLFVATRDAHAPLLARAHDYYAGRWDQGPLSYHLLEGQRRCLAGPSLNYVLVHHLSAHGFGPASMRRLVAENRMVHFAAASALREPAYLRFVQWADEHRGRFALRWALAQAAHATRMNFHQRATRLARSLASLAPVSAGVALDRVAEATSRRWAHGFPTLEPFHRRQLRRAIEASKTPRLYLSPHQSTARGWIPVDVLNTALDATNNQKLGDEPAPQMFHLSACGALESAPGGSLASVMLDNVFERLDPVEAGRVLRAARQALRPDGELLVSAVEAQDQTSEPLRRRRATTRRTLEESFDGSDWMPLEDTRGVIDLGPGGVVHAPLGHLTARFRPRGSVINKR